MTEPERPTLDIDIACVGFGPAMGGFLTTLSRADLAGAQVICYERADDIAFGVSGVVTRARGIRATFPDLDPAQIPMAARVAHEKLLYLLDPAGASRRSTALRLIDKAIRTLHIGDHHAVELPYVPPFLRKDGGFIFSIGQFNQWVGSQLMASGAVQIWPGMPVAEPLVVGDSVAGIRLVDQGPDPGMDVRARLTVVGDGPVGAVGRRLDEHFGLPSGHHQQEWAVGTKMVIDLPAGTDLEPGTVFHTFGYPEPEIFGFFYVHPDRVASAGIFVPSWFYNPVRTSYRYLQHFIRHPYIWRYVEGGTLRSWGAKSLQESGRRGEPFLAGNGYARIGECSGSTNVLTGSGVDEAWTTGTQLAEGVIRLLKDGKPFTKENLDEAYVKIRRASWVEQEGRIAERARDGFHRGVITGLMGMAIAGFTKGRHAIQAEPKLMPKIADYFRGRIPEAEIRKIQQDCATRGVSAHDALMDRAGWPPIEYDGKLLISHQDALLVGGKVQAAPGFADHVAFLYPDFCRRCDSRICVEICSGQAITPGENGIPNFDREKCVHCGACLWNCTATLEDDPTRTNIQFGAGAGGLHSAEN
jgi:electron-transferring-flavoprotein dehydrogenase